MPVTKKTIVCTQEEYNIILDALEIFESKVSLKLAKTVEPKKRVKLKELNISIQELITDLGEDDE